MCLDTIVHLFQTDKTTTASNSLHLVRLLSRLVRARHFAVRPEVISALLNLRLKDELGGGRIRASADAVFREKEGRKGMVRWNQEKNHKGRRGGKAKEAMAKKGSKKAREARKEQYAVEKEMREAEGEINNEERERNMTETLKLLFALYFRIVKLDYRSPLLPAALEGLARFAHLVNIDFFRDLLEVLKGIIKRGVEDADDEDEDEESGATSSAIRNDTRERLLCIVTAFELLQGQGKYSPISPTPLPLDSFCSCSTRRITQYRLRRIRFRSLRHHPPSRSFADFRRSSLSRSQLDDPLPSPNPQTSSNRS